MPIKRAPNSSLNFYLEGFGIDYVNDRTNDRFPVVGDGLDERREPVDAALDVRVEKDEHFSHSYLGAGQPGPDETFALWQAKDFDFAICEVDIDVFVQRALQLGLKRSREKSDQLSVALA